MIAASSRCKKIKLEFNYLGAAHGALLDVGYRIDEEVIVSCGVQLPAEIIGNVHAAVIACMAIFIKIIAYVCGNYFNEKNQ